MISSLLVLISCFNFLFLCMNIFLNLNFTSKATETSFLVVFTDVRLVVPSHCCSEVSWSPDRTFPNLHVQGTPSHKNHTFNITNIRVLQLRNSYRGRRGKQLLDIVKERRGYWNLKDEALDRILWRNDFRRGRGLGVRLTKVWVNKKKEG